MPYVQTRAGSVFYEERGAGLPVVLLHAILHDHRDFDAIAETLSSGYRTIAVDWPWHGRSDAPQAPLVPSARLFADVLEDIVNGLDLPPAIFVGNSVGGFACARLAIRQPDRVRGMVLVNTGGFVEWTPAMRLFARLLGVPAVSRRVMPAMVRRYMRARTPGDEAIVGRVTARARTREGSAVVAALWRSFAEPDYDLRAHAADIHTATLLVWGAEDPVVPLSVAHATRAALSGSQLETLSTGHVVFSSDPAGFLRCVEPFLASVMAG
jgi:pimeloyl-ACP methyl ester carboxylesterase